MRPISLTKDDWEPFGWLPVEDTNPTDGQRRLHYEWDDVHVNLISHDLSEVPVVGEGDLRCEMIYRHLTHTQVLMPIDYPCVIAVAPPGDPLDDTQAIRIFRVEPQESLVLSRATWHWGPFPIPAISERVRLFNVQGLRYADDNEMFDLAGAGRSVDVDLG